MKVLFKNVVCKCFCVIDTRCKATVGGSVLNEKDTHDLKLKSLALNVGSVVLIVEGDRLHSVFGIGKDLIVFIPGEAPAKKLLIGEIFLVWSVLRKLAVGLVNDVDKFFLCIVSKSCKEHVGESVVSIKNKHDLILLGGYLTNNVVLMLNVLNIVWSLNEGWNDRCDI